MAVLLGAGCIIAMAKATLTPDGTPPLFFMRVKVK